MFRTPTTPSALTQAASLAALLLLSACGGSQTTAQNGGTAAATQSVENPVDCESLTRRLCDELGPKTEGCAATTQVTGWLHPRACTQALADVEYSIAMIGEQRGSCVEFANRVCGEFGDDSEPCDRVRADMQEIPPGSCPALLKRYPQIIDQLRALVARNRPLTADEQAKLIDGSPPGFGAPGAKVTIVEFSDFQCPYCSMAAKTVHQIREAYGERIRFVFRQFPLSFHSDAHLASQAALAAHAQGKFWALHDAMFENQSALGRADLERYAEAAGLDVAKFKQALDDGTQRGPVDADLALGETVNISGTPTMFINGVRVENPTDFDSIAPTIDALLGAQSAPQ